MRWPVLASSRALGLMPAWSERRTASAAVPEPILPPVEKEIRRCDDERAKEPLISVAGLEAALERKNRPALEAFPTMPRLTAAFERRKPERPSLVDDLSADTRCWRGREVRRAL
jgi:hypothetical protein